MFVLPNGVGGLFRRIGQLITQSSLLSDEVKALSRCARGGARRRAPHRSRRLDGRPRDQLHDDRHRRHVAPHRAGRVVRLGRARREGVLRARQLARRRQQAEDRLPHRRRRLQPRADRAGGAPARRAGPGLRRLQHARDRVEPRDPRLPEPGARAAALRRLGRDDVGPRCGEVPVDDRLPAELRGRGPRVRPVHRAHEEEGQGRRALPERRLRQGLCSRA